jgi:hypothetical protein
LRRSHRWIIWPWAHDPPADSPADLKHTHSEEPEIVAEGNATKSGPFMLGETEYVIWNACARCAPAPATPPPKGCRKSSSLRLFRTEGYWRPDLPSIKSFPPGIVDRAAVWARREELLSAPPAHLTHPTPSHTGSLYAEQPGGIPRSNLDRTTLRQTGTRLGSDPTDSNSPNCRRATPSGGRSAVGRPRFANGRRNQPVLSGPNCDEAQRHCLVPDDPVLEPIRIIWGARFAHREVALHVMQ